MTDRRKDETIFSKIPIMSIWICMTLCYFQGRTPLYVTATAGTTVYGAFDPLVNIADICEKYKLWMHVDVRLLEILLIIIYYRIIIWNVFCH